MKKPRIYESYPPWMTAVVLFFQVSVYAAGAYVMFSLNWITGGLYVLYIMLLERQVLREGCVNCCYFGKLCAFGKGLVAARLYRKGSPKLFGKRKVTAKSMVPQMLVTIIPIAVGIALLVSRGFSLWMLLAVIYPVASWFLINPIVYGKIACPHCKQGSTCCPALEFFAKKKRK